MVIATRRHPSARRFGLPIFRLDPLSDEQIEAFLERHFARRDACQRFVRVLRNNPRLWEWGRNPLQLWMLAQVGGKTAGELPPNRGKLFQRFVDSLLAREERKSQQLARGIKLDLLGELGFHTRRENRVSFSRTRAWEIVRERAKEMGYQVDSAQFIREVSDNNLLADRGEDLAFAHELYQEYFAALGLKRRYEIHPEIVDELKAKEYWREPIVHLYALLESPSDLFRPMIEQQPAVAAECVQSAIIPEPDHLQQLRDRLDPANLGQKSENELLEDLRAIYIWGDGKLLAAHLRYRAEQKRLKGIGRQIAAAYPGTVAALEATLGALRELKARAKEFAEILLAPIQVRASSVPYHLQTRAAELLAKEWAKRQIAARACLMLIWGFQLERMVDSTPYGRRLIEQGALVDAFRWAKQLHLAEIAGELAQACIRLRQIGILLECIRHFGLEHQIPPRPWIEALCQQKKYEEALHWVREFHLEAEFGPKISEAMTKEGQWRRAISAAQAWEERPPADFEGPSKAPVPIETLIEGLIDAEGLQPALSFVRERKLTSRFPLRILDQAIAQKLWDDALEIVHTLGLRNQYPVAEWVLELFQGGKLGCAWTWTRKLELDFVQWCLRHDHLKTAFQWVSHLYAGRAAGKAFETVKSSLERKDASQALECLGQLGWPGQMGAGDEPRKQLVSYLIQLLIEQGRLKEAAHRINQFGLAKELAETLLQAFAAASQLDEAIRFLRIVCFAPHATLPREKLANLVGLVVPPEKVGPLLDLLERALQLKTSGVAAEFMMLVECEQLEPAANLAATRLLSEILTAKDQEDALILRYFRRLCTGLGFSDRQLEHNKRTWPAVDRLNDKLSRLDILPDSHEVEGLTLFGYLKETGWSFTPYFRDFRVEGLSPLPPKQIVEFELTVAKHPEEDRYVLNAVRLRPVSDGAT